METLGLGLSEPLPPKRNPAPLLDSITEHPQQSTWAKAVPHEPRITSPRVLSVGSSFSLQRVFYILKFYF